jgi:thioredoxin-related protein
MKPSSSLPSDLNVVPGRITVVLFSLPDCEFCAEIREHYLRPMRATRARAVVVAEADVESSEPIRDWRAKVVPQRDFARASGARVAPTVMFFDAQGLSLADPIVGLSRDFFGAYLDDRIRSALKAAGGPQQ